MAVWSFFFVIGQEGTASNSAKPYMCKTQVQLSVLAQYMSTQCAIQATVNTGGRDHLNPTLENNDHRRPARNQIPPPILYRALSDAAICKLFSKHGMRSML
jgi:hypothetical protein